MTKPVKTLHDIEVKIILKASLYSAIRGIFDIFICIFVEMKSNIKFFYKGQNGARKQDEYMKKGVGKKQVFFKSHSYLVN